MDVQSTIQKLKELVSKGNVSRIIVNRKGQQVLNIPVNVGVVGAVVGLAYAKWVMLAGVLATIGFGCTVEVIKSATSRMKRATARSANLPVTQSKKSKKTFPSASMWT